MIDQKQRDEYVSSILDNTIPEQTAFTREEALLLVKFTVEVLLQQLEHELYELKEKDPKGTVILCEYETPVEALKETDLFYQDRLEEFTGYMREAWDID